MMCDMDEDYDCEVDYAALTLPINKLPTSWFFRQGAIWDAPFRKSMWIICE